MKNLVIGNTSQLANYFPNSYTKISSRNLNLDFLKSTRWSTVFLCFGESKKNLDDDSLYEHTNYELTKFLIESLYEISEKIVVYSTCELWNKKNGQISIETEFDFYDTPYTLSKYKITKWILDDVRLQKKIKIIYPFNFNSVSRKKNFLFGKIFHSIMNKEKIEIGDTYFYRDIVHPSLVVNGSIECKNHTIIGSGRLIFVNDFIRDLYKSFGLDYNYYVKENFTDYKEYDKRNEYYLESKNCIDTYHSLLIKTILDLKKSMI